MIWVYAQSVVTHLKIERLSIFFQILFIIGKLRRNLGGIDKHDRYHRGKDVVLVDGNHPAIIDSQIFEKAKQIFVNTKKSYPVNSRTSYTDFMLRGLVRCSNCNSTLTQAIRSKSLQCHKYSREQCNKSHSISLSKINKAVLKTLRMDMDKGELDIVIKKTENYSVKDISETLFKKEYIKLEKIKLAYENGIDSIDEYRINKIKVLERIKKLEKQISKPKINKTSIQNKFKKNLKDTIIKPKSADLSENEKNEILRSFISQIVCHRDNNTIQIYYYV